MISFSALSAEIEVLSATVKDTPLDQVQVIFQQNGQASTQTQTNAQGKAQFIEQPNGTMILKKQGYSTLVVQCPCDGLTYAMSPVMNDLDGMRVVLTWGQTPQDLDSHLFYPANHVYYSNQSGLHSHLDVDDTNGFGPETITLEKRLQGQKYVYAVHDFSNQHLKNNPSLAKSLARVDVYVGQSRIRRYQVDPSQTGSSWVVFGVDEQGAFHDINQYLDLSREQMHSHLSNIIADQRYHAYNQLSQAQIKEAKRLNREGEKRYAAGEYEQAMYQFNAAIDLDPEFAQAYSNLGVTYPKLNRQPEALWANTKAIELAQQAQNSRVQASSHYNIGKIYENEGRRQEALGHYQQAQSLRPHQSYQTAIQRLQDQ